MGQDSLTMLQFFSNPFFHLKFLYHLGRKGGRKEREKKREGGRKKEKERARESKQGDRKKKGKTEEMN